MSQGDPNYRVTTSGGSAGISPAGGGPDNAIARWDGTAFLQGSTWILDDAGKVVANDGAGITLATADFMFVFGAGAVRTGVAFWDGAAVRSGIAATGASTVFVGGAFASASRPGLLILDGSEVRVFAAGSAIFQRWFTLRTELWQSHRWRTGNGATWDAETLAAPKVLAATLEAQFQILDMGGADRTVTGPAVAGNNGLWFTLENTSDANELLDFLNNGGAHVIDLRPGGQCSVLTDGTADFRPFFRGVACFGELYLDAASAALLLGIGGTVVTIFDTAGIAADVAGVAAAGTLTPARDAIYDVSFSVSGTGLDLFTFTIFVAGVATHVRAQRQLAIGANTGVFAANGKVMVPAGAAVTLVGASSAGSLFTFNAAMLNIEKVT